MGSSLKWPTVAHVVCCSWVSILLWWRPEPFFILFISFYVLFECLHYFVPPVPSRGRILKLIVECKDWIEIVICEASIPVRRHNGNTLTYKHKNMYIWTLDTDYLFLSPMPTSLIYPSFILCGCSFISCLMGLPHQVRSPHLAHLANMVWRSTHILCVEKSSNPKKTKQPPHMYGSCGTLYDHQPKCWYRIGVSHHITSP